MIIKYQVDISKEAIMTSLNRLTNQIFKVLPMREEGGEWKSTLQNLIVEISGMNNLLIDQVDCFFSLLCKMEGMLTLDKEEDYLVFRSNIFECLGLIGKIKKCL